MSTIIIPQGFSYVGAALLSTIGLLLGQNVMVSKYRKLAGIKYPQMYAEKSEMEASQDAVRFNCAQRAHQNTLENLPVIHVITVLTGLKYPILAASACALWTLGRISYTRGYVTGDPKKRGSLLYRLSYIGLIGLLVGSVYTVGEMVVAGI